jgi:nucleoside-diphosphate-sugar epimerase
VRLLVFGLGYTAQAFVRAERSRFSAVAGTVRSPEKAGRLAGEGIATRLLSEEGFDPALVEDVAGADAVLVSVPPGPQGGDPVLARFADALAAAPRLRWLGYLSTVGVYGDRQGAWVDETAALDPGRGRSRQRVAVEREWLRWGEASGRPVHLFRLAGIYGPGRNPLRNLADGSARRIVKPGQVFNRIHVEDIAAVLAASIDRPRHGGIYNVADDEPAPPQDVVAYAAELMGRAPPPAIPFEEAELSPMALSFYSDNRRIANGLIKEELGVRLRYPTYRDGLRALFASGGGAG